jgi:hyaluronan synthase
LTVVGALGVTLLGILGGRFSIYIGIFNLTVLGGILSGRSVIQQVFAYRNNRRMKELVRGSILRSLHLPTDETKRWKKRYWMMYPQWRTELWRAYPDLEEGWANILAETLQSAAKGQRLPKVGVEIPIHGVSLDNIKGTVESVRAQTYPVSHIILGVNGHRGDPIEKEVENYVASLNDARVRLISLREGHKRGAMAAAYRILDDEYRCDISVNADADTVFDPDAIWIAVLVQTLDPRVRAITSNVEIENPGRDFLSSQTSLRYLYANLVERAAESWFYCVACMSGPFMQCYTEDIRELLMHPDEWEHQYFRGERVGPGDDRTLTQRLLSRGHGTTFVPDIHTYTECPATIDLWKRQQLRWSRSGLRGFAIEILEPWFWRRFAVLTIVDELYLALFSFLLTIVVLQVLWRTLTLVIFDGFGSGGSYLLPYIITVVVVNVARAVGFAAVNRDPRMLGILGYPYYLVRYLIWIKYRALLTLPNSNWGTRQAPPKT